MHYINNKQLAGTYKQILASSSVENKRLWAITTIKAHRFHTSTTLHFEVTHGVNGTIHTSDKLSLAIKAYNNIQLNEPDEDICVIHNEFVKSLPINIKKVEKENNPERILYQESNTTNQPQVESLCKMCERPSCNLRNRETTVQRCVSYHPPLNT